jgi:5'-3' exonuclease
VFYNPANKRENVSFAALAPRPPFAPPIKMGIKGLPAFLKKRAPAAFRALPSTAAVIQAVQAAAGSAPPAVAVDVPSLFYRIMYSAPDVHAGCLAFVALFQPLREAGVRVLFVFDGPHKPNKQPEAARRQARMAADRVALAVLKRDVDEGGAPTGDLDAWMEEQADKADRLEKLEKRVDVVRPGDYAQLARFLTNCGFLTLVARDEGEAACAWLETRGHAHAVVSDDFDVLPFGARVMVRNYGSHKFDCQSVSLPAVLPALGLPFNMFVQFCVLCGSDFTHHLPGMGPVKALKTIRAYKTLAEYTKSQQYALEYAAVDYAWRTALAQFVHLHPPLPSHSYTLQLFVFVRAVATAAMGRRRAAPPRKIRPLD